MQTKYQWRRRWQVMAITIFIVLKRLHRNQYNIDSGPVQ